MSTRGIHNTRQAAVYHNSINYITFERSNMIRKCNNIILYINILPLSVTISEFLSI